METRLVVLAQAGDQRAFEQLADQIGGRLHAVAFSIVRDRQLAEDATQQALLGMWRGISKLRDPERFEAWAYRLLVRACHAEIRSWRRKFADLVSRTPETRPVEDGASAVADRDELERGFARLSFEHRTVLVLHYYLDMPASQIADVLDIPPGTARSRLYQGVLSLRAALEAEARPVAPSPREETVR